MGFLGNVLGCLQEKGVITTFLCGLHIIRIFFKVCMATVSFLASLTRYEGYSFTHTEKYLHYLYNRRCARHTTIVHAEKGVTALAPANQPICKAYCLNSF